LVFVKAIGYIGYTLRYFSPNSPTPAAACITDKSQSLSNPSPLTLAVVSCNRYSSTESQNVIYRWNVDVPRRLQQPDRRYGRWHPHPGMTSWLVAAAAAARSGVKSAGSWRGAWRPSLACSTDTDWGVKLSCRQKHPLSCRLRTTALYKETTLFGLYEQFAMAIFTRGGNVNVHCYIVYHSYCIQSFTDLSSEKWTAAWSFHCCEVFIY